jgi:hypothetical protein
MKNKLILIFCLLAAASAFAQPENQKPDHDKKMSADLSIYPNPATDEIYIEHSCPVTSIRVFTLFGELVSEFKTTLSRDYILDISELPEGMYFIRIRDEEMNDYSQKVIRQ